MVGLLYLDEGRVEVSDLQSSYHYPGRMLTDIAGHRKIIEAAIEKGNGVLRLEPAWVARDFLPPGGRLEIPDALRDVGERGAVCERWLGSTTKADNKILVPDEGLSFFSLPSKERITLKEAVDVSGPSIMGKEYAATHKRLDRLAKILDYALRLPYHLHQMKQHAALVGRNSKEESYYFPADADMGGQPDSYFGLHPSITERKEYNVFLSHLVEWNSDRILRLSKGYRLIPGDGFHIPAGIVHAPGSALTIELQEDSDVFAMLQGLVSGYAISKELLFKDVRPEDRKKYGERAILDMIDWNASGDPFFYENRHTPPIVTDAKGQPGGTESWIFYNTNRFSGKQLVVSPGKKFESVDDGVYNMLVWKGKGYFDGQEIEAGNTSLDELLVCHEKAIAPTVVENTGSVDLVIFKFFGPDVSKNVPMLPKYPAK
jgi:hypothetical protein